MKHTTKWLLDFEKPNLRKQILMKLVAISHYIIMINKCDIIEQL